MKLDQVKKLQQKKYRQAFGYCLVEGEHLILELQQASILNPALLDSVLYVTESYANWQTPFVMHVIHEKQMTQISDTQTPQGIIARVPLSALKSDSLALKSLALKSTTLKSSDSHSPATETAIYLHEIQDPGNLGTILRTLAWFGGFRCLLSPSSVDPFNPKVIRASMGAIFHVPLEVDVPLDQLSARFKQIACLDLQGLAITTKAFKSADCYLFGNEARGISKEVINALNAHPFTIAGSGQIDSLNLASAVNICVYERQR